MTLFELNEQAVVVQESFMGSNIYYIDDFYKHPDDIVKYFDMTYCPMHRGIPTRDGCERLNVNGKYFDDRRHHIVTNGEIVPVYNHLSKICGHTPDIECYPILTNKTRFFKNKFNDYKNNYWHPHRDVGYTALIYMSKDDSECGTNLYRQVKPDLPESRGEHVDPWRSKENYEIIKTLEPKFNRCVLFDGLRFIHGMHIPNERYFGDQYRLNQVFFFRDDSIQA
jgi:hypothetical protein